MGRRRKRFLKFKIEKDVVSSITSITLLLISGIMVISFFAKSGSINKIAREIINEVFGVTYLLVPIILAYTALFLIRSLRFKLLQLRILLGFLVFYFSLSGILSEKAGLLGIKIRNGLFGKFGNTGATLVFISFLIISILLIFNISIDSIVTFIRKLLPKSLKIPKVPELFKSKTSEMVEEISSGDFEGGKNENEDEGNLEVVPNISEPMIRGSDHLSNLKKPEISPLTSPIPHSDRVWEYPSLDLLLDTAQAPADRGNVKERAQTIEKTLESFGIRAHVVEINMGPAVTQYALETSKGTKIARITNLSNDLALALASPNGLVRIEAPIPGKSLIGIEVPNFTPTLVTLKSVLGSEVMKNTKSKLSVALGLDVAGKPYTTDIGKMPHVLIAGSTGSGKSVLLNSFISTLLFRCSPNECKLILIDPKRVEFASFQNIPHLLTPVIVEPDKAIPTLKWAVMEMDRRYRLFENARVRNVDAYNEMSGFQSLPYVIIFVDELAELMGLAKADVEKSICRLAQKSRATGIHLILATQRPSVDVLTGLIKANIPCRISFNVTSQIDSRVIIDMAGAEKLLGRGDMLYVPPDASKPIRIQGSYISDAEIERLAKFLTESNVRPEYLEDVTKPQSGTMDRSESAAEDGVDSEFRRAVEIVCQYQKASSSLLQRRLSIGYAKAARILDEMEAKGIVGHQEGSKARDVLISNPADYFGIGD